MSSVQRMVNALSYDEDLTKRVKMLGEQQR